MTLTRMPLSRVIKKRSSGELRVLRHGGKGANRSLIGQEFKMADEILPSSNQMENNRTGLNKKLKISLYDPLIEGNSTSKG